MRNQKHPVAQPRRLTILNGVVERRLLGIDDAPPQRIRREQSVPSRMPVRWITRIRRVVDHADGDDMLVWVVAGQRAPAPTSRPDGSHLYFLASEIHSGRARSVDTVYVGRPSFCIQEYTDLLFT